MPDVSLPDRVAAVHRRTAEKDIPVRLNLDGSDWHTGSTGIGFFDHMLSLLVHHAGLDLDLECDGDLHVDEHHTVEDAGIALGQALRQALGTKEFIARYGMAYVPMDETLARAVIDLSGRFTLHFAAAFSRGRVGGLPTELVRHFWRNLAEQAACILHLSLLDGNDMHHQVEAIFKAAASALKIAAKRDPASRQMPSTKGML